MGGADDIAVVCGVLGSGLDRAVMISLSTIKLLREWARWGEANNIGYPSLSPMFGERALKTALFGIGHIPPDVMRTEIAVCRLTWEYRQVLILRYQRHMPWRQIANQVNRDWRTAKTMTQRAENEVHHNLSQNSCRIAPTKVGFAAEFRTVS